MIWNGSFRDPYAPEPVAICRCAYCKEGIIGGDRYAKIDGRSYHLECLEDMTTTELLGLFDVDIKEADESDAYDDDRCYARNAEFIL